LPCGRSPRACPGRVACGPTRSPTAEPARHPPSGEAGDPVEFSPVQTLNRELCHGHARRHPRTSSLRGPRVSEKPRCGHRLRATWTSLPFTRDDQPLPSASTPLSPTIGEVGERSEPDLSRHFAAPGSSRADEADAGDGECELGRRYRGAPSRMLRAHSGSRRSLHCGAPRPSTPLPVRFVFATTKTREQLWTTWSSLVTAPPEIRATPWRP